MAMKKKQKKQKKLVLSKSKLGYTTSNVFKAPLKKVWNAATHKKHLMRHFIDSCKGEFGPELAPVTWTWKRYGSMVLDVAKFEKEKEIVFHTPGPNGTYLVTVRFEFLRKGGKTIFRIHEHGYKPKDLKQAFMMCEGWTEFHTGIKAYIKWGGDLRKV
jgi:uncharacterized protein YndB with AHSA1/START domain